FKYQLLNPQYFRGLIEKLYDEEGARVFVQIGMGRLTGFVENILQGKEHGAVATGSAARDGAGQLRRALALLFVEGRGVDSGFLGVKPQYRVASHSVIPIPVGSPIVREFPLLREIVQKRYAPIGRQAGAAGAGVAGATAGAAVANAASRSAAVAGATSAKSAGATANTKATGAGAANAGAVAAGSAAGAVAGSAGAGTTARSAAGAARVAANAGSAAGSATGTAGAGAASAAVNAVAAGAMANTKATGTGAANVGAVAARSAVSTGVAAANVGTATNAGAANAGAAANAVAAGAMANTKATGTGAANVGAVAARLAASTGVAAANVGTAANAGAANAGAANAGAANARIAGAAVNAAAASVAMASAAMASAAANLAAYVAASAGAQPAGPRWPDAAPRDCGAPVLVAACDNLAGAAMYEIDRLCGGGAWLADAYPVAAAAAGHAPGLAAPAQMAPARGPSPGAAWPASPSAPMPGLPMPNAAQPDRAGAPPPATSMPASAPTVSTPAPMPASAPGAPPPATSLPGAPAPAPASPPATLAPAPAASLPGAPMPTPAPASATAASRPATPVPASASTPPPAAPAPASAPAPMPGLARPAVTPVRPAGAPARRGATATKSGAAFEQPLRLTLEEHPYLLDHAIVRQPEGWMYKEDLNPVVPFTMMIELLAEVALARAPGRKIVKIGPARAYRWISVETPFEAAIVGKWKSADRLALAIKGYADAEFTLGGAYPEPPPEYGADPDMGEALMPPLEKEEAYEKYAFHGPAYHSNEKFVTITKKGMLFTSRRAAGKASLLDGAGQALGLYLHLTQAANTISFPTRVKEMVFYQDMFDQSGEFDVAMFATLTDNLSIGDFVMRRGGRPWMSARGWVGQRFENDRSMWNVLLRPQRYLMARELAPGAGAYYYSNYYDRAANWLMLLKRYLNRPEALRYGGLGSARQKLEYLIGAIALKDAVRKFLGGEAYAYPVEIFYEHDESGRPRVRGVGELGERLAGVHVSIARKGSLVVAIASGKPVGIDLELIGEPKPEAFTESVFAPRERELLGEMGASERAEWTARLRVAKEAYAKMAGTGLDENPRQFEAAPLPAGAAGAGAESAGAGAGDNAESAGAGEGEESAGAGA
ncbi:MAG: 4'-phosphopantetheinyl transferase superfamily protein, partial [Clostridiales bacterium]|nr:4'-phosphopantetheinyl transferase superfamily protein [Clostridiales bacterium]